MVCKLESQEVEPTGSMQWSEAWLEGQDWGYQILPPALIKGDCNTISLASHAREMDLLRLQILKNKQTK